MPKTARPLSIRLDAEEQKILRGEWSGEGGFQSTLASNLASKLSDAGELELSDTEVGEIMRHMSYSSSGFRNRVRSIFRRSFTEVMNSK